MKIRKAACYCRFSSNKQREESIQKQLEKIKEYCTINKIELIREFIDEAQSGTSDKRTSFLEMMEEAKYAEWSYVIVYKSDRMSRNVEDSMHYKKVLHQYGIQVISVIESFDNDTPEGGFFNLITMGMAEFYSKNLARESFAGVLQSARQCKVMGGYPPLGYGIGKNKKYIVDEKQAEAVRIIFNKVIEGKSYMDIARFLNKKGYENQFGRPFRAIFTDILQNTKYVGIYEFNKRSSKGIEGNKSSRVFKPEKEIIRIPGGIPQIIDNDIFEKVQEILDNRKKRRRNNYRKSNYLLTGFLECKYCGYGMSGNSSYSGSYKSLRLVYRCNHKQTKTCITKDMNLIYLDNYIEKMLRNVFLNIKNAAFIAKEIKKRIVEYKQQLLYEIESDKELILQKGNEIKHFADSIANTRGQSQQFAVEEMNELILEKDRLEIALMKKEYCLEQEIYITKEEIMDQIREYAPLLKQEEVISKKDVINRFVSRIIISNEEVATEINLFAYSDKIYKGQVTLLVREERDNISLKQNHNKIKLSLNNVYIT